MTKAQSARENSYAPYSHFRVGAALLTKSGKIYTGCNIEISSQSPTVCAERVALFKAVSEGEREFEAIAVVGGREGETADFCAPCGVCRQALSEFCGGDFLILLGNEEKFEAHTMHELLPFAFGPNDL